MVEQYTRSAGRGIGFKSGIPGNFIDEEREICRHRLKEFGYELNKYVRWVK